MLATTLVLAFDPRQSGVGPRTDLFPTDSPGDSPHLKAGSGGQLPANPGRYIPLYNDQAEVSGESRG